MNTKHYFEQLFLATDNLFQSFFDMIPTGITITPDISCQELILNSKAAAFFRVAARRVRSHSSEEPPGFKILRDGRELPPEEMPIQRAAWRGEEFEGEELEFLWDDGVQKFSLWSARPIRNADGTIIGSIAVSEDLTERKRLESQLLQHRDNLEQLVNERTEEVLRLDRLNLIGEMAAAIGHEVRNPLTTVRGYLQMYERKHEDLRHTIFPTLIEELDRANAIISEFLSLAKNKTIELKPANLNDIISALLPLLQAEAIRTGHDIQAELGDIPDILLDEKEIRQLLLNLAKNGLEAMEHGGILTIRSSAGQGTVALSISDTGKGIPQTVLAKLGTPFVTTKAAGTGLGLAVCYRIADRHNARLDVSSTPHGTTFRILFKTKK